jgi:hypothetical protein
MKNGLIVCLILLSVFLFSVRKRSNTITTTKIDTVTVIKTFEKYIKGDKIPFKTLDTIYKKTYDTTYIVKDYNQAKEYIDTIKEGKNIFTIKDTITNNRIIGRSFKAEIQEKIITVINNIEIKPKAALYLGIRSDLSQDMLKANHNVTLTFKTRKKGLFIVGYGMSGYSIGYSLKL